MSSFTFTLLRNYAEPQFVAEGTYGAVFKSALGDKPVAIKVVRDFTSQYRSQNPEARHTYLKRIFREVQVMTLFRRCEEFAELLDMYMSPNEEDLYLVMPFYDHSLASVLSNHQVAGKGLDENLTRYIVMQVLVALTKMEQCHCIHRDITPGNILVTGDDYNVYLSDFGLSRACYDPNYDITNVDMVTRPYRPPEILLRGTSQDNCIDIWSLGMVTMELLLGGHFLHANDDINQLNLIFRYVDKPESIEELTTYVSLAARDYLVRNWNALEACNPDLATVLRDWPADLATVSRSSGALHPRPNRQMPSQDCLDVLHAMLRFNPHKRKHASELLEMEWFKQQPEDDRNTMFSLMNNPEAPAEGFSIEVEQVPYEEMKAILKERCLHNKDNVVSQLTMAYEGRHYDREGMIGNDSGTIVIQ